MSIEYNDTGHFKLNYKTLYIGGSITILGVVVFIILAQSFNVKYEIRDIIAMFTCGIVTTTLIYHAKNLRFNYEANKAKLDFDIEKFREEKLLKIEEQKSKKIIYSFESTTLWFKPEMSKNVEISRSFLLANKKELLNGSIDDIKKKLEDDQETRKAIACVLNYFENISLMILRDMLDEETVKSCFRTVFVDYFKVLKRFIDELQKTSSRYLMNYEEVAKKWEKN